MKELLDSAQLKDCQNLVDVVKKLMFGNNLDRTLNYQAFKDKFELKIRPDIAHLIKLCIMTLKLY